MMVCRRRWCFLAVVLLASSPALVLGAAAPAPKTPTAMEGAHGKDAVDIRKAVIAGAPAAGSDQPAREAYAKKIMDEFSKELTSTNPDARLNTAILIHDLGTLNSDRSLIDMTKNADPAVRYWGVKGLADIAGSMKLLGGADVKRVTDALKEQGKVEKTPVVQQEILKALTIYEDVSGAIEAVKALALSEKEAVPDRSTLDALATGLNFIETRVAKSPVAEQAAAANAATIAASFTCQQAINLKVVQDSLPVNYATAVTNVIDSSMRVVSKVSRKPIAWAAVTPSGSVPPPSPDEIWLKLEPMVGSAGKKGTIQDAVPGVEVPAAIIASQGHP